MSRRWPRLGVRLGMRMWIVLRQLLRRLVPGLGVSPHRDRRRHGRSDVDVGVTVSHAGDTFAGRLSDVSISGALLACDRALDTGSSIQITLPQIPVPVAAMVVRSRGLMAGIRFDDPNYGLIIAGWSRGSTPSAMLGTQEPPTGWS